MTREFPNQTTIRAHYTAKGWRLWRNNVGALQPVTGGLVRFGLANDSEALNRALKSADLIGWRPVVITPDMVGQTIAQFVSIETKRSEWTPGQPSDKRYPAQRRWADMVRAEGGLAGFMVEPDRWL